MRTVPDLPRPIEGREQFSWRGALRTVFCGCAFLLVVLSAAFVAWVSPQLVGHAASDYRWAACVGPSAAETLRHVAILFPIVSIVGSAICRRYRFVPHIARFLTVVTITIAVTCYVFGDIGLSAVYRYYR